MISKPILIGAAAVAAVVARAQDCDCYLIDGDTPTYYKDYGFWDFRSLSQYAVDPPVLDTAEENVKAGYTSDYFVWGTDFRKFWGPQNFHKKSDDGKYTCQNSFNNLYIAENPNGDSETLLRFRTAKGSDSASCSEIESATLVDHASMRMYARTYGDSGACTSMFTYVGPPNADTVQESDIEILTKDPEDHIHYTNQPGSNPGGTNEITMPDGKKWSQWLTHRLDWTPGKTAWFVDGKRLAGQTFQAPVAPSTLIFNAWSDGGSWSGEMADGGVAYQDIQWVEIAYNLADEGSCTKVCNVGNTPGSPSTAGKGSRHRGSR